MSITQLISKGIQDVYLTDSKGMSFFKVKYSRHTNFAQTVKELSFDGNTPTNNTFDAVKIQPMGDLVNYIWLEGDDLVENLAGTVFELYIGGNLIDSQTFDFKADIWQMYLADSSAKTRVINNLVDQENNSFFPLHFFFCDHGLFLPLIALKFNECEIRIKWGPSISSATNVKMFANYIFLDAPERAEMEKRTMDMVVTQVQRIVIDSAETNFDIGIFNHPVKAIFFGFEVVDSTPATDSWTFDGATMRLNGNVLFEKLSPTYFHTAQIYYHTRSGLNAWDDNLKTPTATRYFMYSFAQDASSYLPTGTCNFSRLDSARLAFEGLVKRPSRVDSTFKVYALNYNVLRISDGMAGILFSN